MTTPHLHTEAAAAAIARLATMAAGLGVSPEPVLAFTQLAEVGGDLRVLADLDRAGLGWIAPWSLDADDVRAAIDALAAVDPAVAERAEHLLAAHPPRTGWYLGAGARQDVAWVEVLAMGGWTLEAAIAHAAAATGVAPEAVTARLGGARVRPVGVGAGPDGVRLYVAVPPRGDAGAVVDALAAAAALRPAERHLLADLTRILGQRGAPQLALAPAGGALAVTYRDVPFESALRVLVGLGLPGDEVGHRVGVIAGAAETERASGLELDFRGGVPRARLAVDLHHGRASSHG